MAKAFRVESKDSDGNPKVVIVKKPTHKQLTEAQFYSSAIFNKAKNAGACLRSKLDEYMRQEGLFTKEEEDRAFELTKKLEDNIKLLREGKDEDGNKLKLSFARELAIQIRRDRLELNLILAKRREHDTYTVEGQAENARFDYLVSVCIYDEDGKQVFESVEDYYNNQDQPYASEAASKLASIAFNIDEDWEKKLPETEFLIKYKFVDENLRYINKDGKFVNSKNELVDELGRRVNEQGELIDADGKVISEVTETAEFEDDVYNT